MPPSVRAGGRAGGRSGLRVAEWFLDDNSITICWIALKLHRVVGLSLGKKPIEIDDDPKSKMATSHWRPS
jgi:hypothetical protein